MAEKTRLSVGLDLGSTKTAMAIVQQTNDQTPEVLGFAFENKRYLKEETIVNLEAMHASISACIKKIETLKSFPIHSVTVNLPVCDVRMVEGSTSTEFAKIHEVTYGDLSSIHRSKRFSEDPEWTLIHSFPEHYCVDELKMIQNPVGMKGKTLGVSLNQFFTHTHLVNHLIYSINKYNLSIDHLVIDPLSHLEALITPDEAELGVLLIDINGAKTHLAAVSKSQILILAPLAVGGDHVTSDIAIGLRTSIRDAERIKTEYGIAIPLLAKKDVRIEVPQLGGGQNNKLISQDMLSEIIQPRMEEILEMVADRFRGGCSLEQYSAGVVITGGGSLLPGTRELAEKHLQMPVIYGNLRNVTGLTEMAPIPLQSSAVGLALWGLHHPVEIQWGKSSGGKLNRYAKKLFNWLGGDSK